VIRLPSWARWATLAAALLLLNASLTFHNVWPTLGVRLATPWELSPELALVVLALVAWAAWPRRDRAHRGANEPAASGAADGPSRPPRAAIAVLASLSLLFVVARYAEVTAPALYGRPVNLYWDARHVGNVVRMLADVAGPVRAVLVGAGALLAAALAFVAFRVAWTRIATAVRRRDERRVLGVLAGGVAAAWIASLAGASLAPDLLRYAVPVTATYAQQARLIGGAMLSSRAASVPDAETGTGTGTDTDIGIDADAGAAPGATRAVPLTALAGDDVLLVFLESYGAVTYTRPEFAARLERPRQELAEAIAATGRRAVSATVTAPTFGGNSWLSHLTLLTGTEVADPDAYARTMQVPRTTLVQEFAASGYRTVALMPGLRQAWPEGAFYRFDAILGADALDYRGPEFGWWRIPDQYALVALERDAPDPQPRFVFFTTISSHAPFRPTPPYQPDWERMKGAAPYGDEATAALAVAPDWTNLGPAYADTIAYAHEWLAGWLRRNAEANVTVVVLGDHQPPAAVSGPGADWTVPIHVVTRRDDVSNALRAVGFVAGLRPPVAPLMRMHELRPVLRAAFTGPAVPSSPRVARAGDALGAPLSAHDAAIGAHRVDVAGRADARGVGELLQ
jgi:hypothetical protein